MYHNFYTEDLAVIYLMDLIKKNYMGKFYFKLWKVGEHSEG